VRRLLEVVQRLVDAGNTAIVIEHNIDVVKCADYVIDLGPEGGEAGGRIVATGTPEAIAKNGKSITGPFLAPVLAKARRAPPRPRPLVATVSPREALRQARTSRKERATAAE